MHEIIFIHTQTHHHYCVIVVTCTIITTITVERWIRMSVCVCKGIDQTTMDLAKGTKHPRVESGEELGVFVEKCE